MRFVATNAASSGVRLDRKTIKRLSQRSDVPGLIWLAQWAAMLGATGYLLHLSLGTWWGVPTMIAHGTVLTVPNYALSHETAHGTAFRTRWLNELVLYISSLIYLEEPYHRRYSHASHHTYTYHFGKDNQMPHRPPRSFWDWLLEMSNVTYIWDYAKLLVMNALGRLTPMIRQFTPEGEFPRFKWSARICLIVYAGIAGPIIAGYTWPLMFLVIPRLVGGPAMTAFTILQHAELAENSPSILESTRSFRTNWLARFLYMNMNYHLEHHLYPQVPFHALPALNEAVKDQIPEPDPGFRRTNLEGVQKCRGVVETGWASLAREKSGR